MGPSRQCFPELDEARPTGAGCHLEFLTNMSLEEMYYHYY